MRTRNDKIFSNTLEIYKEDIKFSIAHFTIFNARERENIHGHNFEVFFKIEFKKKHNGMFRNYREIKKKLREVCSEIDEFLIIAEKNKFIKIKKTKQKIIVSFNKEELVFLPRDVKFLPIENTTVEDFSEWILKEVIKDKKWINVDDVIFVEIEVSSFKGQSGTSKMIFK